uniref:Reverse transcriptase domain-containing protein n=1 Tax=Oryzias latipes TaxID=8090 RepID=A0A3P9H232_ORYLA
MTRTPTDSNFSFGPAGHDVHFITWNVKSLNTPVKRKKVLNHLNKLKAGIVFLQETHLRTFDHFRLRGGWIGQSYHSNFHSKSRGVAILINKNVPFDMSSVETDSSGRYVIVTGRLLNTPVVLVNVYAPHWEDSSFFPNFFPKIPNMNTHHLIFGGDMNCVLSPSLDRSSSRPAPLTSSALQLQCFLSTNGVIDIWRFLNPTSKHYSFFSPVHRTYSRIDNIFIDKRLLSLVRKCEYQAIVISDHAPLLMTLRIPTSCNSYRPWRFNNTLLSDEKFTKFISSEITFFFKCNLTPGISLSTVWESLKAYLRGQIISYCAQQKKSNNQKLDNLTKDIFKLDTMLSVTPSEDLFKLRLNLQTEFNLLSTGYIENLINKAQCRKYEHGEKAGKILAHQLHQKAASRAIIEINDQSGNKHRDHLEINSCFYKYYSTLYDTESCGDPTLFDAFFKKINVPLIENNLSRELDKPFSVQEVMNTIKSMQNGKCPGPDGFSVDFFKKFSNQLSPFLLSVFEESLATGTLPPTMRQAVISLIPKPDKNPHECGSYRPISLLNVDNKILSKMLAGRLETVLPSIIADDQTGFIKGRQSFYNVRRLFNILYGPASPDVPEVLLSLDAEKAFDRVEWDYMLYTLKQFGFSEYFISWIKILYSSPLAAVCTNNNRSPYFSLKRGTRQGCPLSPLLFAIMIEPLAIAIRQEINIIGINRYNFSNKVSLYADDMLLFLSNPLRSLPVTLNLLEEFGRVSGYKVNLQKSEIMPVNAEARKINFVQFPFKASLHKIKYLGISVTHSFKDIFKSNFLPLLAQLKKDLERWSLLPLSLGGKINTIKMNTLPKFLYIFQCVPIYISKSFFTDVDKLISGFLWNKKNPRIRKSVLQQHRKHGGLSLPNFQLYYWAANIRAMLHWKVIHSPTLTPPAWLCMENSSCLCTSPFSLLCSKLPYPEPLSKYTSNPVVQYSLKIWAQFRRVFSLKDLSKLAPVFRNHQFIPSTSDEAFHEWSRRGVCLIDDLFIDNTFACFDQLLVKFNIPRSHFFRYLQLRSFVFKSYPCFPSHPPDSLLESTLKINVGSRGTIGKIYSLLNTHDLEPLTTLKSHWEEELHLNIPDSIWSEALDNIHSSSICLRHQVIQFKIVHRLHWSKAKLSKFVHNIDPTCDRCSCSVANLSHMFWSCSKLDHFWESIFTFFSDVLRTPLQPSVFSVLFGVLPVNLDHRAQTIISFGTLIARRLILLKWKEKYPPTFNMWLKDLLHFLVLEKIRSSMKGSVQRFYLTWNPILEHLKDLDVMVAKKCL